MTWRRRLAFALLVTFSSYSGSNCEESDFDLDGLTLHVEYPNLIELRSENSRVVPFSFTIRNTSGMIKSYDPSNLRLFIGMFEGLQPVSFSDAAAEIAETSLIPDILVDKNVISSEWDPFSGSFHGRVENALATKGFGLVSLEPLQVAKGWLYFILPGEPKNIFWAAFQFHESLNVEALNVRIGRGNPRKLRIFTQSDRVRADSDFTLAVGLFNTNGEIVKSPKDIDIQWEVVSLSTKEVKQGTIFIREGSTYGSDQISISDAGAFRIQVEHRELLGDVSFLEVERSTGVGFLPTTSPWRILRTVWTQSATAEKRVSVDFGPKKLSPNGKDEVEVFATRPSGDDGSNILTLVISCAEATEKVTQLTIERDRQFGSVKLSGFSEPGKAAVKITSDNPGYVVDPNEFEITVVTPVDHFDLRATNPVFWVDLSTIDIQFRDVDERAIATKEEAVVKLRIDSGPGSFSPSDSIVIHSNAGGGRSKLVPFWIGEVTISASVNGYLDREYTVTVEHPPVAWMAFLLVGGAAGGLVWVYSHRKSSGPVAFNMFIRTILGLVFYLGVIQGFYPSVTREFFAAAPGAFFVAFLGGYYGPKIIRFVALKIPQKTRDGVVQLMRMLKGDLKTFS